ncbi:hypothetical protein H9N25_10125 [Pedobacter riviphilus]|uniref:Beta/gamma crystallin 'Greek key' domain-containing protein n=1 Tax=Pedobacter riviphilus TaxID=2766984 RepID=A0ABX6TN39_9SPHI|nr:MULTISPECIES: hypothetical protein [Pedobacter]NII83049.1 hypothetical protein [Pedobacter sp. SG908]QNR86702.1 hypothetical protein H9N25_10125 [Pedobacter riviphilus]
MKNKKQLCFALLLTMSSGILMNGCKKAPVSEPETNQAKFTKSVLSSTTTPSFVTNTKNLNIVMFVPTDNPALPDYKTRLTTLFTHFQNWFHTEMLRYGYDKYLGLARVDSTNLIKFIEIPAAGPQADYPYDSSISGSKILNEINAYKATHASEFSNSSHMLILLPQRTDGGGQPFYGLGKNCFALDNANMAVDKIPNPNSNYLGGMLHELGHGLNLPHDHAKYASEEPTLGTSLMGAGNVSFSKGQPTFLTEVDAAILNRNEIFQNPLPIEIPYESATTTINANATFNSTTQAFNLSGSFTSNKEVTDILVYMDPNVNNEGTGVNKDYNAVTWRFTPGTGNTIAGSIPLSELYYKNNEPYELKAKLLLKNGNVITQTYTFSFLNGVPQIGANGSAKFYQNASYGGYGISLPVGQYTTADLISRGISNNDVSSVNVGLGVKVILYDGDNFTGSSIELTSSSTYVSTFNDKASSIKVIAL